MEYGLFRRTLDQLLEDSYFCEEVQNGLGFAGGMDYKLNREALVELKAATDDANKFSNVSKDNLIAFWSLARVLTSLKFAYISIKLGVRV
jgi:hypothetical protein